MVVAAFAVPIICASEAVVAAVVRHPSKQKHFRTRYQPAILLQRSGSPIMLPIVQQPTCLPPLTALQSALR